MTLSRGKQPRQTVDNEAQFMDVIRELDEEDIVEKELIKDELTSRILRFAPAHGATASKNVKASFLGALTLKRSSTSNDFH